MYVNANLDPIRPKVVDPSGRAPDVTDASQQAQCSIAAHAARDDRFEGARYGINRNPAEAFLKNMMLEEFT